MLTQAETIWAEIEHSLTKDYQLRVDLCETLSGGYMNLKWKITTPSGEYVVKQYNAQRYGTVKRLHEVEQALIRQRHCFDGGVSCPEIITCDERVLHTTPGGVCFMVMTFAPGQLLDHATITPPAMTALGRELGRLHSVLRKLPYAGEPLDGPVSIAQLREAGQARLDEARRSPNAAFLRAAMTRMIRLDALDDSFLQRLTRGYAHSDFARDNVLFAPLYNDDASLLSPSYPDAPHVEPSDYRIYVLDFDRLRYGYLEQDIGRALMSFAFDEARIRAGLVNAFVAGYNEHMPLTRAHAIDAIWYTWCLEYGWWVADGYFMPDNAPKVQRFLREVLFINEHGVQLDDGGAHVLI